LSQKHYKKRKSKQTEVSTVFITPIKTIEEVSKMGKKIVLKIETGKEDMDKEVARRLAREIDKAIHEFFGVWLEVEE